MATKTAHTRKDKAARNARILDWHEKGLTFAQLGKKFRITRQRAHQIVARYGVAVN